MRVSGKEGITQEDFANTTAWAEQVVQEMIAAHQAAQQESSWLKYIRKI